jgi:hypothetical protein
MGVVAVQEDFPQIVRELVVLFQAVILVYSSQPRKKGIEVDPNSKLVLSEQHNFRDTYAKAMSSHLVTFSDFQHDLGNPNSTAGALQTATEGLFSGNKSSQSHV